MMLCWKSDNLTVAAAVVVAAVAVVADAVVGDLEYVEQDLGHTYLDHHKLPKALIEGLRYHPFGPYVPYMETHHGLKLAAFVAFVHYLNW